LQHIHPIFDTILSRQHKENLLEQKAVVLWMLGLSGSGKSTLAREVEQHLHAQGYLTQLLDGDNLRTGINNNLGFSEADRLENIRRAAETAKLFLNCGIITICSLSALPGKSGIWPERLLVSLIFWKYTSTAR
jgi:adenylylsulfate kinase